MKTTLLKYKIGLLILLAFSLVLVGLVVVQAGNTKQDTKTNNAASDIADKLNTYVDSNQTVPATLTEAGVKNVPASISYQKLSDSSYKFCATYKGGSSGFDATGAATDLLTGSAGSSSALPTSLPNISSDNTQLTIDTTYHKGANCQTVNTTITPVTPSPQPCTYFGGHSACPVYNGNGSNSYTQSTQSGTLCGYGLTTINGCLTRCTTPTKTTAERLIDGKVTDVTGANTSSMTLTIKDTKNAIHQVSVTSSTKYYDSSCTATDPSNFQTDDEVRVVVDAAVVYPGGVNDHVAATELDDLSY